MTQVLLSNKVVVCGVNDVVESQARRKRRPDGERIVLYSFGGRDYATSDTCTHGEVSMSKEGLLTERSVEWAWQFGSFDITTGKAALHRPQMAYPAEIIEGSIHVYI